VQGSSGHGVQIGWSDVVVLDLLQNFRVDAHLLVRAILLTAGVNADDAELAEGKAEAERGKNTEGKYKN